MTFVSLLPMLSSAFLCSPKAPLTPVALFNTSSSCKQYPGSKHGFADGHLNARHEAGQSFVLVGNRDKVQRKSPFQMMRDNASQSRYLIPHQESSFL